jgi:hypothetical protein
MRREGGTSEMGWLMGFEPTTTGITIRDSTTELQPPPGHRPGGRCLNNLRQPHDANDGSVGLACPTGFEPVTLSLEG